MTEVGRLPGGSSRNCAENDSCFEQCGHSASIACAESAAKRTGRSSSGWTVVRPAPSEHTVSKTNDATDREQRKGRAPEAHEADRRQAGIRLPAIGIILRVGRQDSSTREQQRSEPTQAGMLREGVPVALIGHWNAWPGAAEAPARAAGRRRRASSLRLGRFRQRLHRRGQASPPGSSHPDDRNCRDANESDRHTSHSLRGLPSPR